MAKATSEKEISIFLDLNEAEARFLKNLCQNHLSPHKEIKETHTIRVAIFNELKRELDK